MRVLWQIGVVLLMVAASKADAPLQPPVPELPRVRLDTHWDPPTGGKTWSPHTAEQFQRALTGASPGDTIVLDAGAKYAGSFSIPGKPNTDHKWIYIEGTEFPAAGERVNPVRDSAKMPKIVATGLSPAISILPGASDYRFVGIEFYSVSNQGCNLEHEPRINCSTYFLIDMPAEQGKPLPDAITIDRCYMHGSDTQDVRAAVVANGTNVSVIDSYISDIHQSTADSQAVRAYRTPGPIKIANNFLSASTENVMFGGAGGADNPYVASDIEIRGNHFYKPERWATAGVTLPPSAQWSVKNLLEFKSARRVLVAGNVFENNWAAAQKGFAIVLTVRTSDSGNIAVVDDVTVENNLLTNVSSGMNALAADDMCTLLRAPFCNNPGEARRWKIANNLIVMRSASAPGGHQPIGLQLLPEAADIDFRHNTVVGGEKDGCWASIYFSLRSGSAWPLAVSSTSNVWITDNALCGPPTGDWGGQGTAGLESYMGVPRPLDRRFTGNAMAVPSGVRPATFPAGNLAVSSAFRFSDPNSVDYQLLSPVWTKTTDGRPAGVDMNDLRNAIKGASLRDPCVDATPSTSASRHRD